MVSFLKAAIPLRRKLQPNLARNRAKLRTRSNCADVVAIPPPARYNLARLPGRPNPILGATGVGHRVGSTTGRFRLNQRVA